MIFRLSSFTIEKSKQTANVLRMKILFSCVWSCLFKFNISRSTSLMYTSCYPTMQSKNGHYCSYMLIKTFYTYVNNKKKETIVVNLYIKVKNWNPIKWFNPATFFCMSQTRTSSIHFHQLMFVVEFPTITV